MYQYMQASQPAALEYQGNEDKTKKQSSTHEESGGCWS
jgi:hypothetical protein